jgi:hypothetical protein
MAAPEFRLRRRYVAAAALLVLNDHWLKSHYPGSITGKLSDFAGLFFFPVLLAALIQLCAQVADSAKATRHSVLAFACIATAITFTLCKSTTLGADAYRIGLGVLQWPFRAALALLRGGQVPVVARVQHCKDPTDLIALPMVLLTYWFEHAPQPALAAAHGDADAPGQNSSGGSLPSAESAASAVATSVAEHGSQPPPQQPGH